jgi:predicted nucleotidyltransferase
MSPQLPAQLVQLLAPFLPYLLKGVKLAGQEAARKLGEKIEICRQIEQIAARFGIQRVRVFGSVARGTDDEQSDVDFLVELAPDRSLLDLGGFLYEMRSLLGTDVDVVTEKGIRKRIRERVLAEAVDL